MTVDPVTGAAVVTTVGNIIGGLFGSSGASKQAKAEREAAERRLKYDQEAYNRSWMKLNADRAWAMEGIRIQQANDERAAAYRDATNQQQYLHQLAIRNREQASLEAQFAKSNELFSKTVTQNAKAAQTATDSEWRKLDEIHAEGAFDAQEQRLAYLQQEGTIRAKGAAGRSAGKVQQSAMASFGQQVAMLNEGIASAGRNTKAMIDQIKDDQYSADLAAWAAKMMDPGELPMPIQPLLTPRTEYQHARPLNPDFDRGPEPILGGYPSASGASMSAWGAAIPSIALGLGKLFTAWSDIELKENIRKVGLSPSGLNIYEWNYIGESDKYRGVIAQDLIAHGREDAVEEGENGYLMVRYDKIDVDMHQLTTV
tara:strand:+ start:205 stop:1314 length:1110 start_codon:yes stop_codon:yes gene_type:complete